MCDAKTTKASYLQIVNEKRHEIHKEFVFMLDRIIDDEFGEDSEKYFLRLNGNKRNDRNEVYRRQLTDEDVEIFYLLLKTNTFITKVDFSYNIVGNAGAKAVSRLLKESGTLELLNLRYNDIETDGMIELAKGLQMNESLKSFDISGNKIGSHGGLALAGALQVNNTLEELNVNNTELDMQALVAITTVLRTNNSLKTIDVGRPILQSKQEESTVHFARMLEVNRSLTEVHLSKNDIQNFGAERLTDHLKENFTLLHLDLSCNRISRDGVRYIADYLKCNATLQVLNLAYNRAEDDGAIYLSDALKNGNDTLRVLVLCSNQITGKGICTLTEALDVNTSLQQLYIWGNELDEQASQAIYERTVAASKPRFKENDTDVRAYVVDGVPYLARFASPY